MILATIIGATLFFLVGFMCGAVALAEIVKWKLTKEGENNALEKLKS